ncbi:MAG TPA: DUF3014 domain-containing protein [Casimicrobiaceae bacterium]|nr:DUF3014 domain-containing protein [Casimicrobiaceae bacterium]
MDPSAAREPKLSMDAALIADEPIAEEPLPRMAPRKSSSMFVIGAIVLIAAVGISAWFISRPRVPPSPPPAETTSRALPKPPESASPSADVRHPIPENPGAHALPELADSDPAFGDALAGVLPGGQLGRWLIPDNLIRNVVASVDNLPRRTLPRQRMPLARVPGTFSVSEAGAGHVIAAANAQRYEPLVHLLEAIDPEKLVAVYVRWYPRFQDAYRELGYSDGYFNDRLVEAIDSLLASPRTPATISVVQPKVMWQFEDPNFEALPIGQRIMLRMGPGNAAGVKAKLAAIRRLVASGAPDSASAGRHPTEAR